MLLTIRYPQSLLPLSQRVPVAMIFFSVPKGRNNGEVQLNDSDFSEGAGQQFWLFLDRVCCHREAHQASPGECIEWFPKLVETTGYCNGF